MARRCAGRRRRARARRDYTDKTPGLLLTLDDVKQLPHHELVTEFKCIEGWSEIVHWGGVRFADLIDAYPPAKTAQGRLPRYVYMETPFRRLLLRVRPGVRARIRRACWRRRCPARR